VPPSRRTAVATTPDEVAAQRLWQAVLRRDAALDSHFVYAVTTTGIFCRPTCPSRRPHRENVLFFSSATVAAAAGYRPCRRCNPGRATDQDVPAQRIVEACRLIETAESMPSLAELARHAGLSSSHFHRLFAATTGLTPKAYGHAVRSGRLRQHLRQAGTVTAAMLDAGYAASSSFYAKAQEALGMAPSDYRRGAPGTRIEFAITHSSLGAVLVASTDKGVCAILLGDDAAQLALDLRQRFPASDIVDAGPSFSETLRQVVALIDQPSGANDLPLDIRGTAFQHRVWQALRAIPAGRTITYAELARSIGRPTATRAVAGACAANPIAVAVPCHRVVSTRGDLSGYRWGVERKRALLEREARASNPHRNDPTKQPKTRKP